MTYLTGLLEQDCLSFMKPGYEPYSRPVVNGGDLGYVMKNQEMAPPRNHIFTRFTNANFDTDLRQGPNTQAAFEARHK